MRSFDSGSLGNPRFQIDSLLPNRGAMVQVQLRQEDAENLVRWHRPEFVGPLGEWGLDDDDFCDAVIAAVHAWVATFPLLPV